MGLFDISKPGDDILDPALANKDKLFDSDDIVLKLDQNESSKDDIANGDVHNVNPAYTANGVPYTPVFMSFVKDGSGNWYPVTNGTIPVSVYTNANPSGVFTFNNAGATRTVRTFIFVDKLTL